MSTSLMEYIDYRKGGADKYHGEIAEGYDEKRESDPKWQIEQQIIEEMLSDLPEDSVILDVPCGTGRFFEFYNRKGFQFCGVDLSSDMLKKAVKKVVDPQRCELAVGDVRSLQIKDKSVDASVMVRLTRWLSPDDCQKAVKELQRVSKKKIIFTARVANHPHARTVELFESALEGWKIARNAEGYQPEYRIIMLEPA